MEVGGLIYIFGARREAFFHLPRAMLLPFSLPVALGRQGGSRLRLVQQCSTWEWDAYRLSQVMPCCTNAIYVEETRKGSVILINSTMLSNTLQVLASSQAASPLRSTEWNDHLV